MSKNIAYFISDAHLGIQLKGHENREKHLIEFLRGIHTTASQLFILGDLFDFWIEYDYAIRPDYFTIVHELKLLSDTGTEIHYCAGNHDFALGSFLSDKVGIVIHTEHCEITIQDKKLFLYHGDGLIKSDTGYRILKKILRNPLNQKLFKLFHPNFGIKIAAFCSGSSRKLLAHRATPDILEEYRQCGIKLLEKDYDAVIFGHTHYPEIVNVGNKSFCNTGEWIRQYNYTMLDEGTFSLWKYNPGAADEHIPPSTRPK